MLVSSKPGTVRTIYRGQRICQDASTPLNTKGRYSWGVRLFAQLNHAKAAIDEHLKKGS